MPKLSRGLRLIPAAFVPVAGLFVFRLPLVARLNLPRDRRSAANHKFQSAALGGYYHSKFPATILKFRTTTNRVRSGSGIGSRALIPSAIPPTSR